MKKILWYCLLLTIVAVACKKDGTETWYEETLDKRLSDTVTARQATLVNSLYGWKTIFTPAGGGAYLFYMKFKNDNRVDMVSDINMETAARVASSSYVFRVTGEPSLVFDTYNSLHIISHPSNAVSGGVSGQGKVSDYEFYFKSVTKDSVVLVGVKNKSLLVLKKATQAEEAFYRSGGIKTIIDEASAAMSGKFLRIEDGTDQTPASIDFANKTASIMVVGTNNQVTSQNVSFVFSADADGLDLLKPLIFKGKSYDKIYWDPATKEFYLLDGTKRYLFKASDTPTILAFTPPFHELFGTDKHKVLKANPRLVPQAGTFKDLLDIDLAAVASYSRTYTYFSFSLEPTAEADITLSVRTASSTFFIGSYLYKIQWIDKPNGIFKFQFVRNGASNYAASTLSYSAELRNYLQNNTFKAAYLAISRTDNLPVAGFINVNDPKSFLMGVLGNTVAELP